MLKRWSRCVHLALLAGLGLLLAAAPARAAGLTSGIDRTGFDDSARPQDDFNRYVNGRWFNLIAWVTVVAVIALTVALLALQAGQALGLISA